MNEFSSMREVYRHLNNGGRVYFDQDYSNAIFFSELIGITKSGHDGPWALDPQSARYSKLPFDELRAKKTVRCWAVLKDDEIVAFSRTSKPISSNTVVELTGEYEA